MKLEDCKPGVRVRAYKGEQNRIADIKSTMENGCVILELDGVECSEIFHPQQLRKIVPKKNNPEVIVGIKETKEITSWVFSSEGDEVNALKKNGFSVWLMRGVKKL